ncbi:MAG TPA: prepilin-type N-terminal cleavage/methylation domain-containing protein [Candidatus Pacearchaeota archaeon]|nr:prepilin-type N-terminal cleavage/methylation domain-containing protein [Candidatus Pacearchaeota archaeon]
MNKNKSFTLIELLVVIVIIGILAGVIMISTSSSIDKANIAKVKVFEESVQNNLAANLVSRWKLDEGSGVNASDAWGANLGTLTNFDNTLAGVGESTNSGWLGKSNCISGSCLKFNGVDDYVNCDDSNSLDIINGITLSVWINPITLTGGTKIFIEKMNAYGLAYNMLASNLSLYLGGARRLDYPTVFSNNTWHHVTGTWDGANMRLYINGLIVNSGTWSGSITSDKPLQIGGGEAWLDNWRYFNGIIDDVRVYDAALSSFQIKQNYIAGLNSMLSNGNISNKEYNERINELAYDK